TPLPPLFSLYSAAAHLHIAHSLLLARGGSESAPERSLPGGGTGRGRSAAENA
uniref:Uncharacterized protein n=1 Tax=Aegilops tauschii subsp. strangulata TaxID=200361 RepID=A0A453CDN0_AEGTS